MRRADRLFEIIQILRSARAPVTAARLAETLEVTTRTVYRDIAALQAMRVPVDGSVGIGYAMRKGYDLPPLMFTADELEAIVVGLGLIRRTGDRALETAARRVSDKIATVLPDDAHLAFRRAGLYSSGWGAVGSPSVDLQLVRQAIREVRKLRLSYRDPDDKLTDRVVRPIAVVYYVEVVIVAAWCELRQDFRHFRTDRIVSCAALDESFADSAAEIRAVWLADRDF